MNNSLEEKTIARHKEFDEMTDEQLVAKQKEFIEIHNALLIKFSMAGEILTKDLIKDPASPISVMKWSEQTENLSQDTADFYVDVALMNISNSTRDSRKEAVVKNMGLSNGMMSALKEMISSEGKECPCSDCRAEREAALFLLIGK